MALNHGTRIRRWQALLVAFAIALLLAGLAGAWRLPLLAEIDIDASRDLQRMRTPALDIVMADITFLGSSPAVIAAALIAAVRLRLKSHPREAVAAIFSLIAMPLNALLKFIANRPRPTDPVEVITKTFGSSFPSGHSMSSAAIYGTLAALVWTLRGPRWLVAALLAIPLLVGVSRVYLGAHWGYDVLAGWSAGALCVAAVMVWLRKPPTPEEPS